MKTVTRERLTELVDAFPDAGTMTWKSRTKPTGQVASWNARCAGKEAGCRNIATGYVELSLDDESYLQHRLMWLYVHGEMPPGHIDHINGNRSDNRIQNLRVVTQSINAKNQKLRSTNKTGVHGVYRPQRSWRWAVRIMVDGVDMYLGRFDDFDSAVAARKAAEIKYGFHPNHGRLLPQTVEPEGGARA